jgi:hypothetical protein
VLVTAGLAVYAVVQSATGTQADPADAPGPYRPAASPTPAVEPEDTIDAAAGRLQAEHPEAAVVVEAALTGDVDALLAQFAWETMPCVPDSRAGFGLSLYCSRLGLPEGTQIEVTTEEVGFARQRERSNVAALLGAFLAAQPRLDLVAQRHDGVLAVSFATDPVPSDITDATLHGLLFFINPAAGTRIVEFRTLVPTSTAVEQLRHNAEIARLNGDADADWTVWGMSDDLAAKERERHDERFESEGAHRAP